SQNPSLSAWQASPCATQRAAARQAIDALRISVCPAFQDGANERGIPGRGGELQVSRVAGAGLVQISEARVTAAEELPRGGEIGGPAHDCLAVRAGLDDAAVGQEILGLVDGGTRRRGGLRLVLRVTGRRNRCCRRPRA